MRLTGVLQNLNGVENGYLRRCLRSMSEVTDYICVYDDASTEDVGPLYKEFECIVIQGLTNEFHKELFHKQQILIEALRTTPDWLIWHDSDAVLGAMFETRDKVEETLGQANEAQYLRLHLRNLNLWRSNYHIRTDVQQNEQGQGIGWQDLWHGVFWRNTGQLHYRPVAKLHQKQYPFPLHEPPKEWGEYHYGPDIQVDDANGPLLHFGFSTEEDIAQKYFRYRDAGQTGFALDRLVDEAGLTTEVVPNEYYPKWLELERGEAPEPYFTVEEMNGIKDIEEWRGSRAEA